MYKRKAIKLANSSRILLAARGKPLECFPNDASWKNWVTDFNIVPNDSTSATKKANTTKLTAWRTWARAQSGVVKLRIPPGDYYFDFADNVNGAGEDNSQGVPFDGIKRLVVWGAGATIYTAIRFGGSAQFIISQTLSARINALHVGDKVMTLVNPADINITGSGPPYWDNIKFEVGRWVAIDCLEFQGAAGFPPNHYNLQFVRIEEITGSSIRFWPPSKFEYKTTYPITKNVGSPYDPGGPATVHILANNGPTVTDADAKSMAVNGWDADVQVYGLRVRRDPSYPANNQCMYGARSIKAVDVSFYDMGPVPTVSIYTQLLRCRNEEGLDPQESEIDKEVELVEYNNCSIRSIACQSASIRQFNIRNSVVAGYLSGTAKRTLIENCQINSLQIGSRGYGTSEEIIINNSTVPNTLDGEGYFLPTATMGTLPLSNFIEDGGGRLINNAGGLISGLQIGAGRLACTQFRFVMGFNILDITEESPGGRQILHTDLPYPLPAFPIAPAPPPNFGTQMLIGMSPCRSVTATNFTGSPGADDLSSYPPGTPLYSRCKAIHTGSLPVVGGFQGVNHRLWGELVSLRINVTRPYTGSLYTVGQSMMRFAKFDNGIVYYRASNTIAQIGTSLLVNTRVAGERLITPTAVTGAQSGDILAPPGLFTNVEAVNPGWSSDMSAEAEPLRPIVEWEMICDQGYT